MKEYTQNKPISKLKLTREDLFQLTTIIGESKGSFLFRTRLTGLDISEETLETFLLHTELPAHLDNLYIQWAETSSGTGRPGNRLSLQLSQTASQLQVSSPDQTWVLGKSEQLMRFFRQRRPLPFLSPIKKTLIYLHIPPPFWKEHLTGINLLLTILGLLITLIFGILRLKSH